MKTEKPFSTLVSTLILILLTIFAGKSSVFSQNKTLHNNSEISNIVTNKNASFVSSNAEVFMCIYNQNIETRGFINQIELKSKTSIWKPDTIFTYSASGLQDRISFTYDNNGSLQTILFESWQSDEWVNSLKYSYTYEDNTVVELEEEWQNEEWINYYKITSTYDENENKLNDVFEEWQSDSWESYFKIMWEYDENENMINETYLSWQSEEWVDYSKIVYTYDDNDNLSHFIYMFYESDSWVDFSKRSYTYNEEDNILTSLYELWISEFNNWNPSTQGIYTYDSNGNLLEIVEKKWQSAIWVNNERFTYTYDINNNSITGMCEKYESSDWTKNISNLNIFSNQESLFIVKDIYRYETSYKEFNSAIDNNLEESIFELYPNPVKNNLFLYVDDYSSSYVEIINIGGQLCYRKPLQASKIEINISHLPQGLYLIKVKNHNGNSIKKFVKE